jgi:mono/diheme cytochrome c family protein
MVQKSLGRVPRLVIAPGALLSMVSSPVFAQSPAAQRGLTFVRVHCAQCHAIDKVSDSPLAVAPPFRTLHLNFQSKAYAAAWPKVLSPTIRQCPNSGSIRISSRT